MQVWVLGCYQVARCFVLGRVCVQCVQAGLSVTSIRKGVCPAQSNQILGYQTVPYACCLTGLRGKHTQVCDELECSLEQFPAQCDLPGLTRLAA